MSNGRASEDQLDAAHGYLLQALKEEIEAYRTGQVIDHRTGLPKRVPVALLTELARMLKVNKIDTPSKEYDTEDLLAEELDEFLDEHDILQTQTPDSVLNPDREAQQALIKERSLKAHCYKCDQWKPREEFSKNRTKPNGLQSYCKACK